MSAKIWLRNNFLCKYSQLRCRKISYRILDVLNKKPVGDEVRIKGWIKSARKMKDLVFIDINDGSCGKPIQVLFSKSNKPENLSVGASVDATGKIQVTEKGQVELQADRITVVGSCDTKDEYPFTSKQNHSNDYTRQYLHLRPRLDSFGALLRVRHCVSNEVHKYFDTNGFVHINTPVLTANDCEGAGEIFQAVPDSKGLLKEMAKPGVSDAEAFFDTKAYLTVSGQLHLEAAARALMKVYTFGPTFRAENSKSRLHLSEFYMIEGEEAFTDTIQDILSTIENFVKEITISTFSKCIDDLAIVLKSTETDLQNHIEMIDRICNNKFTIMDYDEAFAILENHKKKFKCKTHYDEGLTKEHELFLVEHNNRTPIFVINWPKQLKPFYMKECVDNDTKVNAVDLLVPNVGELCGGSLREDNYNRLKKHIKIDSLKWYLELRKFGNVTTGGFGLGFERYLQFIMNITNIKDTIPFPRWPHSLMM